MTFNDFCRDIYRCHTSDFRLTDQQLGKLWYGSSFFQPIWKREPVATPDYTLRTTEHYEWHLALRGFANGLGFLGCQLLVEAWWLKHGLGEGDHDLRILVNTALPSAFRVAERPRTIYQAEKAAKRAGTTKNKVLQALQDAGTATAAQVAGMVGKDRKAVTKALQRMIDSGRVEKVAEERGVYRAISIATETQRQDAYQFVFVQRPVSFRPPKPEPMYTFSDEEWTVIRAVQQRRPTMKPERIIELYRDPDMDLTPWGVEYPQGMRQATTSTHEAKPILKPERVRRAFDVTLSIDEPVLPNCDPTFS